MTLPKFNYETPKTLDECLNTLSEMRGDAKVLAGGTDLLPDIRSRLVEPRTVIDIKKIEELNELSYDDKGLRIGAAVTLNELAESQVLQDKFGPLWSAVNQIADPVLRNRATLTGNICTASPAGDSLPALLVLDAEVEIASKEGERSVQVGDFFTGVKQTSLDEDEMVKSIRIPEPPEGAKGDYLKWKRNRGEDLAVVGVAGLITDFDDGDLRLALSSVAPTPLYIPEVENILREQETKEKIIEEAVSKVEEEISPITDVRCCKSYRAHMAEVLTKRLLQELLEGESHG